MLVACVIHSYLRSPLTHGTLCSGYLAVSTRSAKTLDSGGSVPHVRFPNDSTFLFCQRCGYNRKPASNSNSPLKFPLDLSGIDARLRTLQSVSQNKAYQKQISKLHLEMERFLASLPHPKSVYNATPNDIARFLVWKDNSGKTKVHIPSCPLFGSKRPEPCLCPSRLAAGTVDSMIGKLRSLFADIGRGGEWNDLLGVGNPAPTGASRRTLRLSERNKPSLGSNQSRLSQFSSRN